MSRARGRPRKEIDLELVEGLLNSSVSMQEVADLLEVNPKTLSNRLKEAGSGFRHHLSDPDLLEALQETCHIDTHGRATGHRVRQAGLSSRAGIRAPREQILRVSREHDPEGNAARQERLIHRRQYTITEPMTLWHIDTYEKLKPYGFYVHGGIDGGTNFMVYITVALNKSAAALFSGYRQAVATFGRPLMLRADMCYEATAIGQDMIDNRGPQAYLTGPSTANQRIENWWNFAWRSFASYYKNLFLGFERRGLLNRFEALDIYALTTVYLSEIRQAARQAANDWNYHPVRPQAARGIASYTPAKEFFLQTVARLDAEAARRLVAEMADHVRGEIYEPANAGNRAAEVVEQDDPHAPHGEDPLLPGWQHETRAAVLRSLHFSREEDHVKRYLMLRQVMREIVAAAQGQDRRSVFEGAEPADLAAVVQDTVCSVMQR